MTEYDYSPEAYDRYLATQNRIAKWVDQTEKHRPEFEHGVPTNSAQAGPSGWRKLFKRSSSRSPPPSRPRDIYVPPESVSSDGYDEAPAHSAPLPSPGAYMYPQQPVYQYMSQPMVSPPQVMLPQPYMAPPHRSPHHSSHRSRSRSRSRSHHSPAYYSYASPPVSPGYHYAYPQQPMGHGMASPTYVMMPQQQGSYPVMPNTQNILPHSAPPSVSVFSVPTPPAANPAGGYFQYRPNHQPIMNAQPHHAAASPSPYSSAGGSWATYGVGSPTHSVISGPVGSVGVISPQTLYVLAIPQYQGIPSTSQHLGPPPSSFQPLVVPQGLHRRVWDLSNGDRSAMRHSIA